MIDKQWWKWIKWNKEKLCINLKDEYTEKERLNKKYNLKLKCYEKGRSKQAA